MRVFAYLRYSSENQSGGVSLEMQRTAINSYLKSHPEFSGQVIPRIDEAKTGTTTKGREGLASIQRDAKAGDIVVVYKLDRLGRDLLDSLQVLKDFEDAKVRVLSATEPESKIVQEMMLAFAGEFSRQLSDRCKRALTARAEAGNVANKAPFGYRIHRERSTVSRRRAPANSFRFPSRQPRSANFSSAALKVRACTNSSGG
jgi:site-specific DNA recombinase